MSKHRNIAVLSHHQPIGSRTGTFIAPEVADLLVQRMAAEKISARVIRMMSPDTVFLPAVKAALPKIRYIPFKLPPVELPGLHLQFPKNSEGVSMASVRANWSWRDADYGQSVSA